MKVALIQMDIKWEDKKANIEKTRILIKMSVEQGCRVIALPEMFNTGFSMNALSLAEDMKGETVKELSAIASEHKIYIIAGIPTLWNATISKNTALVLDPEGKIIATYNKIKLFTLLNEDNFYTAGTEPVIFNIDDVRASVFICYDLRFPELFRCIAKQVQVIFVIANWPSIRKDHWETLLKARAIENQCFVIGVNRTGTDGNGLSYPGASHIFDPSGNDILSGNDREGILIGEINPPEVAEIRSRFPFLRDMSL